MSLKEQAYEQIKKRIVNCEMAPGEVVNERDLIELTGCGRTPVHEAISLLANEGLLRIIPRRGVIVAEITVSEIRDLYEFKLDVEPMIIEKYGELFSEEELRRFENIFSREMPLEQYWQEDAAFHEFILNHCENRYYRMIMEVIEAQSQRIRIATNVTDERTEGSRMEHLAIIRALLDHDTVAAAEAMRAHYLSSLDNIRENALGTGFAPKRREAAAGRAIPSAASARSFAGWTDKEKTSGDASPVSKNPGPASAADGDDETEEVDERLKIFMENFL